MSSSCSPCLCRENRNKTLGFLLSALLPLLLKFTLKMNLYSTKPNIVNLSSIYDFDWPRAVMSRVRKKPYLPF